jgi:predicted DNA-binding transcriptional regulator AlpA
MFNYSTNQAAKKLGIAVTSLDRYIAAKKVPAPKPTKIGRWNVRAWTEEDIERVRVLLPKIANGRKTRYQKQRKKQTGRKSKP